MSTDTDTSWAPSKDAWDALLQSNADLGARLAGIEAWNEDLRAEHERASFLLAGNAARLAGNAARLRDLESFKTQAYTQIEILTAQVAELRAAQKADDTDRYVELRRALLVIGLTPLVARRGFPQLADPDDVFAWEQSEWDEICAEFFALYGHLTADGKPLWAGPPKAPSPETRALIAEALRRRQEA